MLRPKHLALAVAALACETGGGAPGEGRPRHLVSETDAEVDAPPAFAFEGKNPPQHPFMAPNGRSNIHNDGYMSDAYDIPGPLGRSPVITTNQLGALCGTLTFDRQGRLITICAGVRTATLYLLDGSTLATLTQLALPPRPLAEPGQNPLHDFTGGGYFYLDAEDRAVVATGARNLMIVGVDDTGDGPRFEVKRTIELSAALPADERLTGVLPDTAGRLWFVGRKHGVVGLVDGEDIRAITLGEQIQNSFAVDSDGSVFMVTDAALYRIQAAAGESPAVVWREVYLNTGERKPGQAAPGSGTTPTLMDGGYVAITNNADPIEVVVYQRAAEAEGAREVCRVPVFPAGASATENSLIASGRSLFVENNHGYEGLASVAAATTAPGFARVDLRADGTGCDLVWSVAQISAPSVVPKFSRATGLLYTYTKIPRPDAWYFTALDAHTGAVAWQVLAGEGALFNNHYAGLAIGPDGAAYLGVLGGIVRLSDQP